MDDKINFKKLTVIHKNTLNICNWATDIKLCLINLVTVSVYFYATYYTPAANILYQNFFSVFIDDLICRPVQIKARFKHWKNLSCLTFFFFFHFRLSPHQQTPANAFHYPFFTMGHHWMTSPWERVQPTEQEVQRSLAHQRVLRMVVSSTSVAEVGECLL